jgi:hypothetical protein
MPFERRPTHDSSPRVNYDTLLQRLRATDDEAFAEKPELLPILVKVRVVPRL